jgi:pyruvate dehydrogenase E2 component (dihydrolipoamide acetyltransferase)
VGEGTSVRVKASPAAKRKAKAENVNLEEVTGTGDGGLITEKDVTAYLKKGKIAGGFARYGEEETIPLEGVRKIMAERMALSVQIPQVTTVTESDVTRLLELSRESSTTITSFVVSAVVEGLKRFPFINSSIDGERVTLKKYYNIGVSVASPRGLIVPVLHNVEGKDIHQISQELSELATKTRENRLDPSEVSGRTFTVTNSGVFGSLFFTPRINPPESAVLGIGKIMKQPVVREEEIAIRSLMYLCLSYDHRIIDGETAVKFLQEVKRCLESPEDLMGKKMTGNGRNKAEEQ